MNAESLNGSMVRESPCGSYQELSPQEFFRRKELVVVLMKSTHAPPRFQGFREVIVVAHPRELTERLSGLAPGQPLGLVCPDGDCSGRLAIRLSNLGHPVYHLGGGLREWYHSFR